MEKGIQGDMQWRRGLGQMPLPVETPLPVLSLVLGEGSFPLHVPQKQDV